MRISFNSVVLNEDFIDALIFAVLAIPIIGLRFLFEQTTGNLVKPSADRSPLYISRAVSYTHLTLPTIYSV